MRFWEDTHKTTQEIAEELLGCLIVKETPEGIASGWIVETEAYLGEIDRAAHSYQLKQTPRLHSMYQKPGTIYIYQMHTHYMLNLVVQEKDIPEAILIRALEPEDGIHLMLDRRNRPITELTDGPGKLTRALAVTKADDGTDISEPPLYIDLEKKRVPREIVTSPRIGIPNKGEWTEAPLRYTVKGNPFVSRRRKAEDSVDKGWLSAVNASKES